MTDFKRIAVIGAGTMGSGIAGQIANAGHPVLLLDLPGKDSRNQAADGAIKRLVRSNPPSLMHPDRATLIKTGNTEDDFDKLAECDWIVEAIVERLDIKRDLYRRLDAVIRPDCIVTSNTSTIPIRLLIEGMPEAFRRRFAITHYFNPVRYMRLLELVRGEDTDPAVMDRLARYNDEVLGKGVVPCADTPGFLGNRVGVFALQVGMDVAFTQGLDIESADALMGRPMGIPKTGIFGLYDLIGVDLMSDVVDTLGQILPSGDAFHAVGRSNNPAAPLISNMITEGFTGQKGGKGGFYRGAEALDLSTGTPRPRRTDLPVKAQIAAEVQAAGDDPLPGLLVDNGDPAETGFCRAVLARVLAYAADLLPEVTHSPQDIDDAMKLGFNWIRGPFEMIDALGPQTVINLIEEAGLSVPPALSAVRDSTFYAATDGTLNVNRFDGTGATFAPVSLPEGTVRFSFTRKTLTPIARNAASSLYALDGDLRLVEFHSKANALTADSMTIVSEAARDHGAGIIIHNDAQHFSAGVNLNHFRDLIAAEDWAGIDAFLNDFQQADLALKYAPVPVVAAVSGLTLGGGFEVAMHCDRLIAHTNVVMGLVESGVGLVPGGGGVKEAYLRWITSGATPEKAAWETWMQVGYGKTGTSPELAASFHYFLNGRDEAVMNRDKLVTCARAAIAELAPGYAPPPRPMTTRPGNGILPRMEAYMDDGIAKGHFFAHDKTVAMAAAGIVVSTATESPSEVSEQDMLDAERAAFITLAKTPQTRARIDSLLSTGTPIRN